MFQSSAFFHQVDKTFYWIKLNPVWFGFECELQVKKIQILLFLRKDGLK